MGIPTDIQGCASSYTGPMGGVGWVRELVCGQTPDVRVAAEKTQYYEDPTTPGNFHLFGFGIVTGISQNFNPNQLKTRGIGNRDINCNKSSKWESEIEVSYQPVDLSRIPFITGIDVDISTLEEAVCVDDCLPYSSVETFYERECNEDKMVRWLHNMCIVNAFSVSVALGEYVEWTESMLAQYQQKSNSKLYTPPLQAVEVGLNALDPCCDAFMSYEGDIYITRNTTDDLTSQIEAAGSTIFILDYNVMDWNRDGVIDGLLGSFQNRQCYRDIEIYVDGEMIDGSLITVSPINSKYIMLGITIMPGQTVAAKYHYMYQMPNVTTYDFEIAHNVAESRGIWKGAPVLYELQNVTRNYTGNVTVNFKDDLEYEAMKSDEFFHLFFEQGGLGDTPIVWQFLFAKWDSVNPPFQEDDTIAVPMPWQATHLCLDNQIRLPPDGSPEGEEGGSEEFWPMEEGFE